MGCPGVEWGPLRAFGSWCGGPPSRPGAPCGASGFASASTAGLANPSKVFSPAGGGCRVGKPCGRRSTGNRSNALEPSCAWPRPCAPDPAGPGGGMPGPGCPKPGAGPPGAGGLKPGTGLPGATGCGGGKSPGLLIDSSRIANRAPEPYPGAAVTSGRANGDHHARSAAAERRRSRSVVIDPTSSATSAFAILPTLLLADGLPHLGALGGEALVGAGGHPLVLLGQLAIAREAAVGEGAVG